MIKAVVFDCFGVLTTDTWKEFVATLPEAKHREASDLNRAYGRAYINKAEFLKAIRTLTGKQPQDVDGMLDSDITKNSEMLQYISELKQFYKIGLLSNVASDWIKKRFLSAAEQNLFDDFILSYEVHIAKPDPRIFELAAQRLGVQADECVLIDDVEYYGAVAEGLGMKFVLYRNFRQAKADLQKILADSKS